MDIELNFVNESDIPNNFDFAICQKNIEPTIAWTVIQYCAKGDNHPFTFPSAISIGAIDSWGNRTPAITAEYGSEYKVIRNQLGDILEFDRSGLPPTQVRMRNALSQGAIDCQFFRDNRLTAVVQKLPPDQTVIFETIPTIWIGVTSNVFEGQVIPSDMLPHINTELSLLDIASADIVATGGVYKPVEFSLTNIVRL